jgi:hypothetical protein
MKTYNLVTRLETIKSRCLDDDTRKQINDLITNVMEGVEVVTVGRAGSKCANFKSGGAHFSMPLWQVKTYIAKKNYKGELKWFLNAYHGSTRASKEPSQKLLNEATAYDLPYMPHVVHCSKVRGFK